jgi:hypothetical protein
MADSERIRRQVYDLRVEDLERYPLWEFALDEEDEEGQDECTLRPSLDGDVPDFSPGTHILVCDVSFANGTTAVGFIYSGEQGDYGTTWPTIATSSGHVSLWLGHTRQIENRSQELLAKGFKMLGKDSVTTFPVHFRTRVKINGDIMEFVISSFLATSADNNLVAVQ